MYHELPEGEILVLTPGTFTNLCLYKVFILVKTLMHVKRVIITLCRLVNGKVGISGIIVFILPKDAHVNTAVVLFDQQVSYKRTIVWLTNNLHIAVYL